jgi:hypothetical protein
MDFEDFAERVFFCEWSHLFVQLEKTSISKNIFTIFLISDELSGNEQALNAIKTDIRIIFC